MGTAISAKQVSALRSRTGAGMMDCKRALQETGGDIDKAVDLLRRKGIAKAEKRVGRSAQEGVVASYVHFNGKVAVLVEVNCETDFVARTDDFQQLARDIAMHVASAKPIAVSTDEVPAEIVERERAIFEAQVAESGKPEQVRGKIVEGKLKKFYKENVLLEQAFVKDDKKTVGNLVKEISGKVGENVVVRRFTRYELGEE
ncbi:MAG: translation elongation factor Ts [Gemmatimonadales bacterium]|nr:translation elongation factor Ts [Gemmatimonadales bacterium]NIN11682.1 translation elongation factor Ts [Gemmatimonadales bacterium]NIN50288.1 translation elongation factor Ts [Gemmatimonadales bacterium]NIP07752.1 translation elongation factor Ts [Gemmatimonadales bacterium]NIQ99155.1 translation elongation factor Ts [Gemmatimonadales bacterium]